MADLWIDITDVQVNTAKDFEFTEESVWSGPWAEYGLNCVAVEPMSARLTVLPQKNGCLVRGDMTGKVRFACSRCSEDVDVSIDVRIEVFAQDATQAGDDADEFLLRRQGGRIELNVGALLWEEFVLAVPDKPLCAEDCKGLCPSCGKNLNDGACACGGETADPRLAVLKNIKIH